MKSETTYRTSHLLTELIARRKKKGQRKIKRSIQLLCGLHVCRRMSDPYLLKRSITHLSGFHVFPPSSTFPSRPMARLVPARRVREGENAAADATRRVETASFMGVMEDACWEIANGEHECDDVMMRRDDETACDRTTRRTVMIVSGR